MVYQVLKLIVLCSFLAIGVFADEALSGKTEDSEEINDDPLLSCACKKKKRITAFPDEIIATHLTLV